MSKFIFIIVMILLIPMICLTFAGCYLLDSQLNTSTGKVYCDGSEIYNGRLYRVWHYVDTENLQAPYFNVEIHGSRNLFKTEYKYYCNDFKIK